MTASTGDPRLAPVGPARVVLYTRPGCHLCDQARAVVAQVAGPLGVGWREVDITSDAALEARYREQIPVTAVDGVELSVWRVDAEQLRTALQGRAG